MTATLLHILSIGALGTLVRRQALVAGASWRLAATAAAALAAAFLLGVTEERAYAASTGLDAG